VDLVVDHAQAVLLFALCHAHVCVRYVLVSLCKYDYIVQRANESTMHYVYYKVFAMYVYECDVCNIRYEYSVCNVGYARNVCSVVCT